ncbi:hypothetical protein BD413DRAFT_137084 [Trametes elegans]|nr:hypothetical protein BD413DRAFT_137084 [Trametes elegans]
MQCLDAPRVQRPCSATPINRPSASLSLIRPHLHTAAPTRMPPPLRPPLSQPSGLTSSGAFIAPALFALLIISGLVLAPPSSSWSSSDLIYTSVWPYTSVSACCPSSGPFVLFGTLSMCCIPRHHNPTPPHTQAAGRSQRKSYSALPVGHHNGNTLIKTVHRAGQYTRNPDVVSGKVYTRRGILSR